jgi:hypothetical protein
MHNGLDRMPDEKIAALAALAVSSSPLANEAPFRPSAWMHCMPGLDVSGLGVFIQRSKSHGSFTTMPQKRSLIVRPPRISKSSAIDRSKPYLRSSLDFGTRNMSDHGQLVDNGYNVQIAPIRLVSLKRYDDPELKNVAAYDKDGTVIYGNRDVAKLLLMSRGLQSTSQRLDFVKMAFIPKFRNSREVKHVRKVLHGETDAGYLRDFLTDHFHSIIHDIRAYHKRHCTSNDPNEVAKFGVYIDSLPMELQLPVPVMMDDDGRADFRAAAILAGAAEVELREEPLCALAAYMPPLAQSGDVKKGQRVLITDIGGMTVDIATAKLLEAPIFGDPELRMQRIGQCHGSGAGSCFLNAQIVDSLLRRPDLRECLESLEIDEHHLTQQVSDSFDLLKRDINNPGVHEFLFTAHSSHGQSGVAGRSHHWAFSFSRDMILEIYGKWIEKFK